jgi:hypothetical protein
MRNLCEKIKYEMDLSVSRLKYSKHVTTEIDIYYSVLLLFISYLIQRRLLLCRGYLVPNRKLIVNDELEKGKWLWPI